jgi:hypothetical protein
MSLPTPAPTVREVRRIAAIASPVIRNLEITGCYSRLAAAMAARSGAGANWCTYATWASRQAGSTIRGEDVLDHIGRRLDERRWLLHPVATVWRRLLRRGLFRRDTRLGRLTAAIHTPFDAVERASESVARGNLKVFEEIAREFARFLAEVVDGGGPIDGFCASLRPGEPPEGRRYLRQAFTRYHRAMSTTDPKQRAELLLLGNIEIGLHEQTRLQPEITAALQAPLVDPRELERRLLDLLLPGNRLVKWLRRVLLTVLGRRTPVRVAAEQLADRARALARRAVTEHLMTLALPGGELLDLSQDLPAEFPPLLARLADPELLALLATVDPTADSLLDTAARDWSDLPDRMHYIADMFRCHAHRADLLDPPFTPGQVAELTSGRLPTGRL